MNAKKIRLLKAEIKAELQNLQRLPDELTSALAYFDEQHSYLRMRAIGSILHDFYCGIEKILERIANTVDGDLPMGQGWHDQLLSQMTLEIEGTRPKVISNELQDQLKEYLRFRHLFRNIYGFVLKWEKMQPLVNEMPNVLNRFTRELSSFFEFLDEMLDQTNG